MYDLYTFGTPNGRKVSIMLEELGVPYEVHVVDILKGDQFQTDFLRISPNNKIPALVDRQREQALMESGAILIYLAEKHEQLLGADRYVTLEWLMLQMGGIGPMLGQAHHFLQFNPGKAPYAEERYAAEAKRLYGVLNTRLEGREFLADQYSIADIATWPWISRYAWQGIDWSDYPALKRWYLQIADRPAVQRGYDVPARGETPPIP